MADIIKSRKSRLQVADMSEMLGRYKQLKQLGIGIMESCEVVAREFGRDKMMVYNLMKRLQPTTDIAEAYLRAQALRLAVKVAHHANVDQAIEVLSRKSMGVIAPKAEEGVGGGGFFLSVQADSCGAIKIGVQQGGQAPHDSGERARSASLPTGVLEESVAAIDVTPINKDKEPMHAVQAVHKSKSFLSGRQVSSAQEIAIKAARERLTKARRKARRDKKYKEIEGFQVTHGESEGEEHVEEV